MMDRALPSKCHTDANDVAIQLIMTYEHIHFVFHAYSSLLFIAASLWHRPTSSYRFKSAGSIEAMGVNLSHQK